VSEPAHDPWPATSIDCGWRCFKRRGYPPSDITDEHLEHFFFVGSDGSPAGTSSDLNSMATDALLRRSLVVAEKRQEQGFWERHSSIMRSNTQHRKAFGPIYLLTITARKRSSSA